MKRMFRRHSKSISPNFKLSFKTNTVNLVSPSSSISVRMPPKVCPEMKLTWQKEVLHCNELSFIDNHYDLFELLIGWQYILESANLLHIRGIKPNLLIYEDGDEDGRAYTSAGLATPLLHGKVILDSVWEQQILAVTINPYYRSSKVLVQYPAKWDRSIPAKIVKRLAKFTASQNGKMGKVVSAAIPITNCLKNLKLDKSLEEWELDYDKGKKSIFLSKGYTKVSIKLGKDQKLSIAIRNLSNKEDMSVVTKLIESIKNGRLITSIEIVKAPPEEERGIDTSGVALV